MGSDLVCPLVNYVTFGNEFHSLILGFIQKWGYSHAALKMGVPRFGPGTWHLLGERGDGDDGDDDNDPPS